MGFTWKELDEKKTDSFNYGQIEHALFWQNEQIMKKLTDLLFEIKGIKENK